MKPDHKLPAPLPPGLQKHAKARHKASPLIGNRRKAHRSIDAWEVFWGILRWSFRLLMLPVLLGASSLGGAYTGMALRFSQLPDVSALQYYAPIETTEIYDDKNHLLMKLFGEENRRVLPLNQVPDKIQQAVISAEDGRFYEHKGIDWIGMARALKANFDRKAAVQGGSSITQQIVKNTFLTAERTPQRKLAEAWMATEVEKKFSKHQILELYLNQVYWGHNAYGIEAASQTYFGKSARLLKLNEGAMLAGILTGPEIYSPYRNFKGAEHRMQLTLERMRELKFITAEEYTQALKSPLKVAGLKAGSMRYPYFTSYVLAMLKENYGDQKALKQGLRIYTTINTQWQEQAEKALKEHMSQLKRMNAEQAALVAIEPQTGFIRAMVGGRNYSESQFNRAWQAQRQPGSSFKPFVYLTAFARGYTPGHTEIDEPIQFRIGTRVWKPKNYSGGYSGTMTLQRALESSVNIIAVKLGDKLGNGNIIDTAHKLGIRSRLKNVLSLPLGPSEVNPLEMANAYSTIARGGRYLEPTPILRIEDRYGNVLEDNRNRQAEPVYSAEASYQLIKIMKGVVLRGTAPAANIGRPVAGKTGTTSDHRDAWFVGFSPQLCTAVWIGNDTPTRMYGGATGGTLAATLWARFMREAHKNLPKKDFPGSAAGYPAIVAAAKAPENAEENTPRYERLNAKKYDPVDTTKIDPDELPSVDELLPIAMPSSALRSNQNLPAGSTGNMDLRLSVPGQAQNRQEPMLTPPSSPKPSQRKNTRVINELDQLIKELEKMEPPPAAPPE
ncbi:penicillin-binding protein [bacterium (Candidatus Blackallbacteria) CG17_big_fil_post_rev_8_21_14_2_50_48_46]|uniref:Penicillin-binding protein n=1 Tax=bacterium (Candidatus Blackallbacteria) CG17_big_fil_post_rev_8_21_14_2_50_48_46 TaxID=2014261 RepID=A0A2M7G2F3_9BACT|nr:MAG: penicillin-binding protein [bacterium (Candidatus Blackallbacteria) CG18_big_fil_WC_8_21_14_2_50_49_26]PIW15971.1 MAG: penicillin-binding protein [bacterium (Candidatus Blackallbacteria) CG17_big_fil_post_rev_8_21_14_2_50_48_46]PIW50383.1 MAG: penicillin-binding protein [bacterium (Candidatus Blackallbacteria) CG13_big_fil_rev_8_21_14_2_50_49_14]